MDNHEYNIHVEVAYQIFQKCFETGGIKEERGWPKCLSEALEAEFPGENQLENKALSDLYGRICRARDGSNTLLTMSISERTLDLLSRFALIDDYKALNRGFKGLTALYTARPFSVLNLLRIPASGRLFKREGCWIYEQDNRVTVTNKTVNELQLFRMPGDNVPYWLKVDYTDEDGKTQIAYFAQADPAFPLVTFLKPDKLTAFFNGCVKKG